MNFLNQKTIKLATLAPLFRRRNTADAPSQPSFYRPTYFSSVKRLPTLILNFMDSI